jgi:hypothetical protein
MISQWILRACVAGFTLMVSASLMAQEADLYSAEAEVANQDEAERQRALGPALADVLVKVSGDTSLRGDAAAAASLAEAPSLVHNYGYRQIASTGPSGVATTQTLLSVQFRREGVDALLTRLGRAVWAAPRPATLVWLVIDDGGNKRVATAAQVAALGALTGAARARGVGLQFPRLDAAEVEQVNAHALWEGQTDSALAAATRYGAQAALIVRLARSAAGWNGRFTLLDAGPAEQWSATHAEANSVLSAAAQGLADRLARRYAVAASERVMGDYQVWVSGIDSAADFATVMSYLRAHPAVQALSSRGARAGALALDVRLNVSPERWVTMLAQQSVLVADTEQAPRRGRVDLRLRR